MQTNTEMQESETALEAKAVVKIRNCLMCGNKFESDGPHHRICPKCKSTEAWRRG